jgi:hypothetical protein
MKKIELQDSNMGGQSAIRGANKQFSSQNVLILLSFHYFFDFAMVD